jgi:hypothetical protein
MDQLVTPRAMDTPIMEPWWRKRRVMRVATAMAILVLLGLTA